MFKLYTQYMDNFRGLSREIWLLSFVTFINRAGAMVIPFLSIYLEEEICFTLPQVGWIMTSFGLGSFAGTWVGGKLTDSIGFYKVITSSFLLAGLGFIGLQYMDTFYGLCLGVFTLIFVADAYRPAIFVACDTYSKPANRTRSVALIRLAINLGFIIGPVSGGFIIAHINYGSLFWIDGITCLLASILIFLLLKPKAARKKEPEEVVNKEGISPYRNKTYLFFVLIMVLNGMMFVLYFSLLPLYYKNVYFLSEDLIGLLLVVNGVIIVIAEMPLVGWLERIQMSKTTATFWGIIFLALSFLVLNLSSWVGILVIGMVLMTIGEMIGSPFANALALEMSPKGRKGSYMALYSMSYSLSHIIGHNGGMNMVDTFDWEFTWYAAFGILIVVAIMTLALGRRIKNKGPIP